MARSSMARIISMKRSNATRSSRFSWPVLAGEIASARRLTGRPIAVNLLLPFLRAGDAQAAAGADAIVTFWGQPRRLAAGTWIHQCGTVAEAKAAAEAGADAVIAQGVEAGGPPRRPKPPPPPPEPRPAAGRVPPPSPA